MLAVLIIYHKKPNNTTPMVRKPSENHSEKDRFGAKPFSRNEKCDFTFDF